MSKAIGILIIAICTALTVANDLQAQMRGSNPLGRPLFQPKARAISGRYVPRIMQPTTNQVISDAAVIGSGVISDAPNATVINNAVPHTASGCAGCSGTQVGAPIDQVITSADCGGCGGCGSCAEAFGDCGGCAEFDCRDCGIAQDCWLNGIGGIFRNSEYFMGVQGFDSAGFRDFTSNLEESASFGYHVGFNTGLPLYRLTCGLVSGQVGVRWTRSSVESTLFSSDRRDQVFATFGLFRRVDYGVQFGVVADILREEWFVQNDVVQVRGELAYVWPAGHTFGFRTGIGVQDNVTSGTVGTGTPTPNISTEAINTYRFFYRRPLPCKGHREFHLGWSAESQTVFGADYDVPLSACTALQAGFVYLTPDSSNRDVDRDEWNIFLSLSYRPMGRGWFDFYHRPLFPVADNGSMILRRQPR